MAIYFGKTRCDGLNDALSIAVDVRPYYNSASGTKIATISGTDIYSPDAVRIAQTWHDEKTGGWYRIYSDGWCEQGGIFNLSSYDSGANKVTLYKQFKNTNYSVQLTRSNPIGCAYPKDTTNVLMGSLTTTLFLFIGVCGNTHTTVFWEAKGYIQ